MKGNLQHDRVRVEWVVVRICILVALIMLFNFFPERVGVLVSATDLDSFVPLLAPGFQANMPWLNLWWGLALVLEVAHLYLRRWLPLTRWADLALSVLAVAVLVQVMLWGPLLGAPPTATLFWDRIGALPLHWEQAGIVVLDLLVRGGLAVAIVAILIDSGRKLRRCTASQQKPLPAQ